jgi:hypothetical protein
MIVKQVFFLDNIGRGEAFSEHMFQVSGFRPVLAITQNGKSGIAVLTLKGRSNGVFAVNVEKIICTAALFIDTALKIS